MKKKLLLSTLGCSIALTLNACGSESEQKNTQTTESTSATVKHNPNLPTYTMAVEENYPPFAEPDDYRQPSGFDIDLIKAIGNKAQFNVNIEVVEWITAFDGLQAGKYQMIGSGVAISPERQARAKFSDIYATGRIVFATTNPELKTADDLVNKKIGVQAGGYLVDKMQAVYGKKNELVEAKSLFLACQQMIIGNVDVCVDDINLIRHFKNDFKNIADIHTFKAIEGDDKQIAFVIEKDNAELLEKVNTGLKQVKDDGTYNKIYDKWFGE